MIVVDHDAAVWVVSYLCPYPCRDNPPCAWGTGADYATGAMLAGKTAMEAVAIAAQRDIYTGGGVQFIDLANRSAGVQDWHAATIAAPFCPGEREEVAA